MKTLTMTICNRPEYLRQTLDALKQNDLSHFDKLYFGIEPGNKEVENICRSVNFIDTHVHVNPKKLGVRNNPYLLLKRVFKHGSKFNLYLEDDMLISPDATKLSLWYEQLENINEYVCLTLFRKDYDTKDYEGITTSSAFSALGFAINNYQWINYFAGNWFIDPRGWDWSIRQYIDRSKKKVITPNMSRSLHIGREGGVHYVPHLHDRVHMNVRWNQEKKQVDYKLV
jgi:hypothetical protein